MRASALDFASPVAERVIGPRPLSGVANRLWAWLFAPVDIAALVYFRIVFGALMFWEIRRYFQGDLIRWWYIEPTFHFTYYGFDVRRAAVIGSLDGPASPTPVRVQRRVGGRIKSGGADQRTAQAPAAARGRWPIPGVPGATCWGAARRRR